MQAREPMSINCDSAAAIITINSFYATSCTTTGGTPPYTYSITQTPGRCLPA